MKMSPVRKALLVGLPLGMLVGVAGTVLAADPRLDDANGHVEKAIKLLEAADNKDRTKGAEFGGHRKNAIEHLKKAQRDIGKAKEFDDRDDKKDGGRPPKDDGGKPSPGDPKLDAGKPPPTNPKMDGGKPPPTTPKPVPKPPKAP